MVRLKKVESPEEEMEELPLRLKISSSLVLSSISFFFFFFFFF